MLKLTMGDIIGLTAATLVFSLIVLLAARQTTTKNPFRTAQKFISSSCFCEEGKVVL